jgi:hypothetical protein
MATRYHTQFRFFNALANGSTTTQVETHVFNFAKLMSSANRKEFKNVDNQGNAQLYTIGMKLYGTNAAAAAFTAPNTYITQRSVKAWHDARVQMFKEAGIRMKDLGYGRSLRPYLNVNHENGTTVEIDTQVDSNLGLTPHFQGQEWNYSRAAVAAQVENTVSDNVQARDLVDTYSFTLLGDSVDEDTTEDDPDESSPAHDTSSYVSIGMISEWLDSFKRRPTVVSSTAIDADNALLNLMSSGGPQVEEVLELAEDQQEELRPWDLDGSAYTSAVIAGYAKTLGLGSDYAVFQAPCGLVELALENDHTAETLQCVFDVLDIEDM